MSLTASSKRGSGANRIDHPFLRNATKQRGSKKTDFKGLEKILIIIIIIIIVVFIRIIIRNCYCSLRVSAKTNQVRQFSDSQHAIQNHRGKSNLGFQIGNRSSCTKLACVCNHLLRLFCVCNHLLAANFHGSRSLKHWWPMAMTTDRGKLKMNVEKRGHCHIFGEEIIPTCRFLLHLLLDRLKNYSEQSLGQRMNKTAKYISARQPGRNAIITLGLEGNRKRQSLLETFLLAILQRLYWGQQPLLTMANPRLLT